MPTSTVEDYLKCILLEQQRDPEALVSMRQISAALSVAPGTVTAMVKTLADSGLVTYEPYSGVRLTASGRQLAVHVLRRHRLIELFLVKVMGMDWSEVHAEAEELEHAVSDRLIERMDEMLGYPSADPHGDPIPDVHGVVEEVVLPSLLDCELGEPLRVARVGDQSREFLQLLERRGLKPGSGLTAEAATRRPTPSSCGSTRGDAEPGLPGGVEDLCGEDQRAERTLVDPFQRERALDRQQLDRGIEILDILNDPAAVSPSHPVLYTRTVLGHQKDLGDGRGPPVVLQFCKAVVGFSRR